MSWKPCPPLTVSTFALIFGPRFSMSFVTSLQCVITPSSMYLKVFGKYATFTATLLRVCISSFFPKSRPKTGGVILSNVKSSLLFLTLVNYQFSKVRQETRSGLLTVNNSVHFVTGRFRFRAGENSAKLTFT